MLGGSRGRAHVSPEPIASSIIAIYRAHTEIWQINTIIMATMTLPTFCLWVPNLMTIIWRSSMTLQNLKYSPVAPVGEYNYRVIWIYFVNLTLFQSLIWKNLGQIWNMAIGDLRFEWRQFFWFCFFNFWYFVVLLKTLVNIVFSLKKSLSCMVISAIRIVDEVQKVSCENVMLQSYDLVLQKSENLKCHFHRLLC